MICCAILRPIHGSAPKYAGKNVVNPIASIESARMMLDHIDEVDMASKIRGAIGAVIEEGKVQTYDMKKLRGGPKAVEQGAATTQQMADAVIAKL